MINPKTEFFDRLENLYQLYAHVRRPVIFAEEFDPAGEVYIAPINQQRYALDHIFRAVMNASDEEAYDNELKEVKNHLERAGYDAMALLASNIGNNIIATMRKYNTHTIKDVFPEYYSHIRPEITDIQILVANLRAEKNPNPEKSFDDYARQAIHLIEIKKKIDQQVPSLEEYARKHKKEKWASIIITAIITCIATIVASLILRQIG